MALAAESAGDPEHFPGTAGGCARRFARRAAVAIGALTLAALPLALIATTPALAGISPVCKAPIDLVRFNAPLTNLVQAFKTTKLIKIVALGSSSTAGSGASSPSASYPAQLDDELERRFDGWDFKVLNLGVGGQLAQQMFDRLEKDVLPREPHLVLWQTGVNDAIVDIGVEKYRTILKNGIDLLKSRGIDLILVNMQFYPKSERVKGYTDYLNAMNGVAAETEIPMFRRFSIMKHFIKSGQFTPAQLLSPDLFHMNDLSYGCLAGLMADAIEEQVKPFLGTADTARGTGKTPRR